MSSTPPPKPNPVLHFDDPQLGRWGSLLERNGRKLEARFREAVITFFTFDLIVTSTDGSELVGPVVFHLHDSYQRAVQRIKKIREKRFAIWEEISADEDYTVGAQVMTGSGVWTSLELELNTMPELPPRFLAARARLEQVALDDFVSLRADESALTASQILDNARVANVIIRRQHQGKPLYYLRSAAEVKQALSGRGGVDVATALDLHEFQATEVRSAESVTGTAPQPQIVHRDGGIIGYRDPERTLSHTRSALERVAAMASAVPATAMHVHADFPTSVVLGKLASLLVDLRRTSGGSTEIPVVVAPGSVDILVRARQGFALEGDEEQTVAITSEEISNPIRFRFRATEIGPSRIEVLCFQKGTSLGSVVVHATVVAAGQGTGGQSTGTTAPLAPSPAAEADLMLLIREAVGPGNRPCFEYTLKAADPAVGLNFRRFISDPFNRPPTEYFQNVYYQIDQQLNPQVPGDEATRRAALRRYGLRLFNDLFPENLRVQLWDLRHRIKTIQVLSDEPWVPWELVHLAGFANGVPVNGKFLCEEFRLTRWFPDVPRRPNLRLRELALIAPAGSGLENETAERDFVRSLGDGGRRVNLIAGDKPAVLDAFEQGLQDAWHFVGHATTDQAQPDESRLQLEGGFLYPGDLDGATILRAMAREPLVFLNACQTGQGGYTLTGVGGWASQFIKPPSMGRPVGAAAFVGTLWSVKDAPALEFAKKFYAGLLQGQTISEAAFDARVHAGFTGLAYTVFADPFAKLAT